MNIEILMQKPEAENIFRRHHITGRGISGIREGFEKKGSHFMMQLIAAINPDSVLSGNWGPPTWEEYLAGLEGNQASGKGWAFWENLLTMIGKTGETIGSVKENISGSNPGTIIVSPPAGNNKTILLIAGAAVVLVIVLMLIKK